MVKKSKGSLIYVISLTLFFGYIAFKLKKKKDKNLTLSRFLLGDANITNSFKNIFIGLIFGIIFGFLDNYYLITGMNLFEEFLPADKRLAAGWSNTYSDLVGATMGTFISTIGIEYFNVHTDNIPIWVNTAGIAIGCILGMYIPFVLLEKKK